MDDHEGSRTGPRVLSLRVPAAYRLAALAVLSLTVAACGLVTTGDDQGAAPVVIPSEAPDDGLSASGSADEGSGLVPVGPASVSLTVTKTGLVVRRETRVSTQITTKTPPQVTVTNTPAPVTLTETQTQTQTLVSVLPARTLTRTVQGGATRTVTRTATRTLTRTVTRTATRTLTRTVTRTATRTRTITRTVTR